MNLWGQTVSLFAGSPKAEFAAGVEEAKWHYRTPQAKDCDVVITNVYSKANEGEGGIITGFPSLKKEGGDLVLISNSPDGHVSHYLLGNWGKLSNDEFRLRVNMPDNVNRLVVFNEYPGTVDTPVRSDFTNSMGKKVSMRGCHASADD